MATDPKNSDAERSAESEQPSPAPKHYRLQASTGYFSVTGFPVGFVLEGDPADPRGRRLDSRTASGGEVVSRVNADASYEIQRAGPLDLGRKDEARALKVLLQALRASGRTAALIEGANDDRGEDGMVMLDGRECVIQIVSVPVDPEVWSVLARAGHQANNGTLTDAIQALRSALERKRGVAFGTILVLNAAHLGAVLGPMLTQEYIRLYGDPSAEYGLREVWVVGPSARSSFRLIGPPDAG